MIRIGVLIFVDIANYSHVMNWISLSNFNEFNVTFLMNSFHVTFLLNDFGMIFVMNDFICKKRVIRLELSINS